MDGEVFIKRFFQELRRRQLGIFESDWFENLYLPLLPVKQPVRLIDVQRGLKAVERHFIEYEENHPRVYPARLMNELARVATWKRLHMKRLGTVFLVLSSCDYIDLPSRVDWLQDDALKSSVNCALRQFFAGVFFADHFSMNKLQPGNTLYLRVFLHSEAVHKRIMEGIGAEAVLSEDDSEEIVHTVVQSILQLKHPPTNIELDTLIGYAIRHQAGELLN